MSATLETSWKEKIKNSIEIPILTRCCFCFPLRKGLIALSYINLALTIMVLVFLAAVLSQVSNSETSDLTEEIPRMIFDLIALSLEIIMTVMFIVALHTKRVLLMKVYLHFEIVYAVVGLIYSLACMSAETASELFMILFQLMWQIYLAILIWSSLTKMERDGTVKYVRDNETA